MVVAAPRPGRSRWQMWRPYVATVAVLAAFAGMAGGGWYLLHQSPAASDSTTPCVGPRRTPAPVSVRVLNGSGRNGLARRTAEQLSARRFQVIGIGNASRSYAGVAQVRHGAANVAAGRRVAAQVRGAVLVADRRLRVEVDLVLGRRFRALRPLPRPSPTPKVTKGKTKPKPTRATVPRASASPCG